MRNAQRTKEIGRAELAQARWWLWESPATAAAAIAVHLTTSWQPRAIVLHAAPHLQLYHHPLVKFLRSCSSTFWQSQSSHHSPCTAVSHCAATATQCKFFGNGIGGGLDSLWVTHSALVPLSTFEASCWPRSCAPLDCGGDKGVFYVRGTGHRSGQETSILYWIWIKVRIEVVMDFSSVWLHTYKGKVQFPHHVECIL